MVCKYTIQDILYAKLPKRGQPKVGEEYDKRRGSMVKIDMSSLRFGSSVEMLMDNGYRLETTPFERLLVEQGTTVLETTNSMYVLSPEK